MSRITAIALVIVGLIHLIPISGALGRDELASLYGVAVNNEVNVEILLRHRAILLGLIGVLLIYSAFHPPVQIFCIFLALASTLSFIWFVRSLDGASTAIQHVAFIDWIAVGLLLLALLMKLFKRTTD